MCYGVEIEMIALLSRLTTSLEAVRTPQTIISLEDKHGKIINYIGDGEISEGVVPTLTIPVGPNLPHYQVSVYSAGFGYGGSLGSSFLLVSSLLVGIFVLSIITGGILLNAHAQKSQRDAIQKTSFVSNVSHELKTPLTTIRMYTELLHEERITDASKRKNYLQVILNESERLSRLVNNVLDFGRLEQGRKKYELNSIDLSALINEVMEGQCLRLDKAGFETHIELPDTPLMVHSDRDALEQILLNITDNALKYARDGKELTVALAKEGSNVLVQIMDRGPGVPKAHQKHIFTKFHRVDDSLTAEQGGSGLGLTIAYRLLHGLGGQLSVHDREGGGAIFSLVIPTAQKSESHEQYADH
jgi:signal transduction histidine kinase